MLASTWDSGTSDPVKAVIEEVLRRHGWTAPDWFQSMTATAGTSAGTPPGLAAVARRVGLGEVRATVVHPDLGLRDPGALATYRLSMPHIAEWYATLDAPAKEVVFREAEHAARPLTTSWRPGMVVLTGRVRRQPKRRAARCPSDAA